MLYVVSSGIEHRRLGGSEEGGWYYDTWQPITDDSDLPTPLLFTCEPPADADEWWVPDAAIAARDAMQATLDQTVNDGLPPLHSVASRGRYRANISTGWPQSEPREVPRYE